MPKMSTQRQRSCLSPERALLVDSQSTSSSPLSEFSASDPKASRKWFENTGYMANDLVVLRDVKARNT